MILQYGVLYSHASTKVYPDLVDGPCDKITARQRIAAVRRHGVIGIRVQREIVDGKPGPWTLPDRSTDLVGWLRAWSEPR